MQISKTRSALHFSLGVLLSGACFFLGTGLHPVWWALWLAPAPVLLLSTGISGRLTFLASMLSYLLGAMNMALYFAGIVPVPVIAILLLIPAIAFSFGVLFYRFFVRSGSPWLALIALPALWVSFEFLIARVSIHGTFGNFGYTQMNCLPFLQIASVTGIWGLSFCMLFFASALALAGELRGVPRTRTKIIVTTGLLLIVVFGYGFWRLQTPASAATVTAGLIASDLPENQDPRTPQTTRAVFQRYAEQVPSLVARGARLIVMPEHLASFVEDSLGGNAHVVDSMFEAIAHRENAFVVLGVDHVVSHTLMWNQARLYTPQSNGPAIYDKQHLLPGLESRFREGDSLTSVAGTAGTWGLAICKDMDFSAPSQDYARAGAGLLIVPSYDFVADAWLHSRMAVLRGVEGGFSIARTAKSGTMTLSDPFGRVVAEQRSDGSPFATLVAPVTVEHIATWYTRGGDWFAWLNAGGFVVLVALSIARRARGRLKDQSSSFSTVPESAKPA